MSAPPARKPRGTFAAVRDVTQSFLDTLHEATLLRVAFAWEAGRVDVELHHAKGPVTLRAERVTKLVCPRTEPWGPSVSVHGIELRRGPTLANELLEIAMGSGDVLVVEAERFVVAEG